MAINPFSSRTNFATLIQRLRELIAGYDRGEYGFYDIRINESVSVMQLPTANVQFELVRAHTGPMIEMPKQPTAEQSCGVWVCNVGEEVNCG